MISTLCVSVYNKILQVYMHIAAFFHLLLRSINFQQFFLRLNANMRFQRSSRRHMQIKSSAHLFGIFKPFVCRCFCFCFFKFIISSRNTLSLRCDARKKGRRIKLERKKLLQTEISTIHAEKSTICKFIT